MQISGTFSAPMSIHYQDPDMVHKRLEDIVDQLDDLGTKLDHETQVGFYVSREWPANVKVAGTQLRFAAEAMKRLGGDRELVLSNGLLADAANVTAFAGELQTAYDAHERFGTPQHADWNDRLSQPAKDAALALTMLEQAPARP